MKRIVYLKRTLAVLMALALMALAFGGMDSGASETEILIASLFESLEARLEPTQVPIIEEDGNFYYLLCWERPSVDLLYYGIHIQYGNWRLERVTLIDAYILSLLAEEGSEDFIICAPDLLNLPAGGSATLVAFIPTWRNQNPEGCLNIPNWSWNVDGFGGVEWRGESNVFRFGDNPALSAAIDNPVHLEHPTQQWIVSGAPGEGLVRVGMSEYNIGVAAAVEVVANPEPLPQMILPLGESTFTIPMETIERIRERLPVYPDDRIVPSLADFTSSNPDVFSFQNIQFEIGDDEIEITISKPAAGSAVISVLILFTRASEHGGSNLVGGAIFSFELVIGEPLTWEGLRGIVNNAQQTPTTIVIPNDIDAADSTNPNAIIIPAGSDITLVGAGNVEFRLLEQTTPNQRHFIVNNGGTLTLGERVALYGGSDNPGISGGVVVNNNGNLILDGGAIAYNRAAAGGGVDIVAGGQVLMTDGWIVGNTANVNGGGLRVLGEFVMDGGTISGNEADLGGAMLLNNVNAYFEMNGGTIENNTARNGGGAVNIAIGRMVMNDGEIIHNTAANQGGGVRVVGTFEMNGGLIAYNHATNGGGVFFAAGSQFAPRGGVIRDNTPNNIFPIPPNSIPVIIP